MFNSIDFIEQIENYSAEDLQKIKKLVDKALEERASQRFNTLVNQILTAIHCMEKEFPCAEIGFTIEGEDVNLLDYVWDENNFHQ